MVNHALRDGYVRLSVVERSKMQLPQIILYGNNRIPLPCHLQRILSPEQKAAVKNIYELYNIDEPLKNENISRFMEEWNKRPNLVRLKNWWDNIPESFNITLVGKVLAHANAQKYDKSLPSLD